jgi:bacteriocin biosynthesis cyclodehydratase domain-containing protein
MRHGVPVRPLLAPWYRLVDDGDRVLLEHGRSVVVLEGAAVRPLLAALLPLLDGARTVPELVETLGVRVAPAIESALAVLDTAGLLVEGPAPGADRPEAAAMLVAAYGLPERVATERLRGARAGVVGASARGDAVARLLHACGVGDVRRLGWAEPRGVDLAVVAPSGDELGELVGWNELAFEHRLPWLCIRPFDGVGATIGPLVVPDETSCYECLLLRLASHLEYGADLEKIERTAPRAVAGAPFEAAVASLAAHLAVVWIGAADPALPGLLFALSARPVLALERHFVVRVPRCPACSIVGRSAPRLPWHEAELGAAERKARAA